MKNNKQGFTLIELLVVIAIIGLLSTLSIVALNSARARSRDARRVSDIKQIQTALEMYYNAANQYPTVGSGADQLSTSTSPAIKFGGVTFMNAWPVAPSPADNPGNAATPCTAANNAYAYTVASNNTTYTVSYCLGAATGDIPGGINTASPSGVK